MSEGNSNYAGFEHSALELRFDYSSPHGRRLECVDELRIYHLII